MISTQLTGGMGNQMFIYAMGLAQARRLNTQLGLDLSRYKNDPLHRYCLDLWAGVKNIKVSKRIPDIVESGARHNQELINRVTPYSCLQGYWQTEKYFTNIRQELLDIFRPREPFAPYTSDLILQIIQEGRRSVCLGVRRGDYLSERNLRLYGTMSMDYYLGACKRVADNTPDPHFFIFSDDAEWCKQNFKLPYRFTTVNNINLNREDEHIWPMRYCHHAIIPNSSFSWWGAWLNPIPDIDRIVVGPKNWFKELPADSSDIIPDRWIKI